MLTYLGRGPYSIASDRNARTRRERFFRGADHACIRQSAQWSPIDGIDRSVIQPEHDPAVWVFEFDLLDSALDRDGFALVVEVRVAVMRVRGGRRNGRMEHDSQHHSSSSHANGPPHAL